MPSFKPDQNTEIEYNWKGVVERIYIYSTFADTWLLIKSPNRTDGDAYPSAISEYSSTYARSQIALDKYLATYSPRSIDRLDEDIV